MEELHTDKKEHTEVTLRPHGPLVIKGNFEVMDEEWSANIHSKIVD